MPTRLRQESVHSRGQDTPASNPWLRIGRERDDRHVLGHGRTGRALQLPARGYGEWPRDRPSPASGSPSARGRSSIPLERFHRLLEAVDHDRRRSEAAALEHGTDRRCWLISRVSSATRTPELAAPFDSDEAFLSLSRARRSRRGRRVPLRDRSITCSSNSRGRVTRGADIAVSCATIQRSASRVVGSVHLRCTDPTGPSPMHVRPVSHPMIEYGDTRLVDNRWLRSQHRLDVRGTHRPSLPVRDRTSASQLASRGSLALAVSRKRSDAPESPTSLTPRTPQLLDHGSMRSRDRGVS